MDKPPPLACMNCKKELGEGEVKFFAQVFVCETCFETAKSFYEKLELELRHLMTIAKEAVRVSLIQGKFHLSEQKVRDISKRELLEEIVNMEQARAKR